MTVDQFDPPCDDDTYWIMMSDYGGWSLSTLTAADVASLLNIDPANLSREAPQLHRPLVNERGEWWSHQQVYDYILTHRRELQATIPRLYPFTTALRPAHFLFGHVVDGMAVHAWQPSDGRGPIAVAYAAGQEQYDDGSLYKRVQPLLSALPWATAVVCPNTTTCMAADRAMQPYVVVADRNHGVCASHCWFQIAGLLRVALPWWSPKLRDVEAIASWQPGAPLQCLRARVPGLPDPRRLDGLLATDSPYYVRHLVHCAIRFLDYQAADDYVRNGGHDDLPARRGLVHAAVADIDPQCAMTGVTAAEAALLLHQPCREADVARDSLTLLRGANPIGDVAALSRESANPLALDWISRLEPADDHTELGFWAIRFAHDLEAAGSAVYTDPFNPHTWVVITADMIYMTAAQSVPATGQLTELYYEHRVGFFRDSAGQIWPLPATGLGATGTGPKGGSVGRETLASIVTNLILDAGSDVARREVPYDGESLLAKRIAALNRPW